MTVTELVDMLSKLNANPDYICAWNAYGNDTVIEWTLKGGFAYIELTVKLAIRDTIDL